MSPDRDNPEQKINLDHEFDISYTVSCMIFPIFTYSAINNKITWRLGASPSMAEFSHPFFFPKYSPLIKTSPERRILYLRSDGPQMHTGAALPLVKWNIYV